MIRWALVTQKLIELYKKRPSMLILIIAAAILISELFDAYERKKRGVGSLPKRMWDNKPTTQHKELETNSIGGRLHSIEWDVHTREITDIKFEEIYQD